MKKVLSVVLICCMVIGLLPVISLADTNTVSAVRTAYFNSGGNEWKYTDGDNILVSAGATGWEGATTFTDLDRTVTTQASLSGSGFLTARHSLVAFEIPEDLNTESDMRVTLSMKVKNVKQVSSGARLSVYGNSVSGTWSTNNATSAFGTFASLPLLGLTDAIQTGNSTGETASNEVITLSSLALTEYVKKMAQEGKDEVTFRLACTMGGIRIYDTNTSNPPTLTIETGTLSNVTVKTVFYDGDEAVSEEQATVGNLFVGEEYTYTETPTQTIVKGEDVYTYSAEKSILSATVEEDGSSTVIIAYEKQEDVKSYYGYEYEDEGAWCWFADPRAVVLKNDEGTIDVTVIGYIDVHGNIKATQINNLTNKVDEVLIRTNIQPDDHNNPTFIMIPDGRIVTFYSRHTDEACFWYRVTEKPGDLTTLGEEKCLETSANTTYPSPFWLSDDPEHIYLCWRGIEWHPTIAKLTLPDEDGNMEFDFGPYQMVRSSGVGSNVRPYAKYASNGKDKIYMSYTGTHPDNYNPNWLYFNYIDINTMTMHDINGTLMRTIEKGPLIVDHSNQSHIVDQTSNVRNWLWQVAVADDGYPVIANVRIDSSKNNHKYYYVKWDGEEWVKTFLTDAGGKFHPSNTEYCYSGGMSIDTDNPNILYASKPVEGIFGKIWEIFKYTINEDGSVTEEQITQNSLKNNVRPWVIPNSEGDDLRVMWMNGDYDFWMVNSVYPAGYPTRIMGEVELPKEEVDLSDYYASEDFEDIGGVFVSEKYTAHFVNNITDVMFETFTVTADVYLDGDYTGKIMDLGEIELSVQNLPTKYGDDSESLADRARLVLSVAGEDFVSPNVYGTSDEWKNHNIRTGGEYYFTRYDKYVNLAVVFDYATKTVIVYRDGLVDIKFELEQWESVEEFKLGGFDGYVEDACMYTRALNHDEIKAVADVEYLVSEPDVEAEDSVVIAYEDRLGNEIKPSDEFMIYPGTDVYEFVPEKSFIYNGEIYTFVEYDRDGTSDRYVCTYEKNKIAGSNLVPDGDFTDDDGNFSWGTWQTPRTDGGYNNSYYKDNCGDWFYKVNRDTNAAGLYETGNVTAEDYALGTRWNDGTTGTCSLANFIEVEAGKTYYVSYDYKHKTAGTDGTYISTAFVKDINYGANASGNNIPVNVTTEWQTNEFVITAEEDGYIYFHFSYLGNSTNAGNGPYWYFDNFEVYELEKEIIKAGITEITAGSTLLEVENLSADDITIKVYGASYEGNTVTAVDGGNYTVYANDTSDIGLAVGGNVKVFIWNEDMQPLHETLEATAESTAVEDPDAPVMFVTKVVESAVSNKQTLKITGFIEGATQTVTVNPDEAAATKVAAGNVIIYKTESGGYVRDVNVLFASTTQAPADNVETCYENILPYVKSDEAVTIHYGEIKTGNAGYVTIEGINSFNWADEYNITVVDYSTTVPTVTTGTAARSIQASTAKTYSTAFIKTVSDAHEISDIIVFNQPRY